MSLTTRELEFLSAWAREEREPACYQLPAHRDQLAHGITGISLIAIIKAWTEAEDRKDQEILDAAQTPQPSWPWTSLQEFQARLEEAGRRRIRLKAPAA